MTYLWIPAQAIAVRLDAETLIAFDWHEQEHRVVTVTEEWRVDVEWWRLRIWRDYYRVLTNQGYLVVIYHDLLEDSWYLQQLYD